MMRRHASRAAVLLLVLVACASCAREPREKQRLYEVYMPTFTRVPARAPAAETVETLSRDWGNGPGNTFRQDLVSAQALGAAVALGVILLVAWNYRRLLDPRNIDALLMYGAGLCLFDCMRFFGVLTRPAYLTLLDWVFWGVFAIGLALLVRAVGRVLHPLRTPWTPNPGVPPLAVLAAILVAANLFIVLSRPPDDAGWFVNLGAQRLRERGRLPYGDPLLTATPGAAYGPLLYVAHVPFQVLLAPDPVNQVSPSRPALDSGTPYYLPPLLATQLCTACFHLLGVATLFVLARRLADTRTALGVVCLYCGSLAVLGIGGSPDSVAGLTFVSHIAPASMTLLALATFDRAALSGVLLAISTGIGFYPAFMAPAWLGYNWNDRARRLGFLAGFGFAAIVIAVGVYATSRPVGERSRIGTILYDTVGHHTDPAGYGSSPFGFWGQRGGIRQVLSTPLVGSSGLTSPAWLAFLALIVGTFFLARGRSPTDLALLAGAVAIGATLVKPHATGTYLAWYYPLLLVGLFAGGFTSRPQKV
jgi:hypothetical protein